MAEGLLFGVIERIVEKLGSFVLQEIGLWWGVKDEIESMRRTVFGVKAVLLDAENRQARDDDPVNDWLGELKKVVYDAEDLLDDFSTEVLPRKGNKLRNEVRLFFSSSNQLAYGLKMGHKIRANRERLDAVMRVGERFNFQQRHVDMSTFVMAGKREQTHSSPPEVVVGREDDENEIRELLLSEKYSERNVIVISIVGIGGLGKTTLAQRAYQDDNVKKHFELTAWVCVSDHFDVKLIIGKILESVESKLNISEMEMETLNNSLREKINGKKYLFILDDVWNENIKLWCSLIDLLDSGLQGSRTLISTRSEKVANITSQAQRKLQGLSSEKSWSLFAQMAFDTSPTPKREEIGKEIVAKCKGVPLAIRVIGLLMRSKTSVSEWESFKSKELVMMDQEGTSIMATLKLSYGDLPPHLKYCFT